MSLLTSERLAAAYSYHAFRQLVDQLLAEGKTTGPHQSPAMTHYTELNVQRMERLDKTVHLLPELTQAASALKNNYIWLIFTEGWCGDAAQLVPIMEAVAQVSAGHLITHYLLRDDNLDLMDLYLTAGSRAIPRLVVLAADTLREVANWGPRPAPAQELMLRLKSEGQGHEEYAAAIQAWYAHDKTQTTQHELLALLRLLA